MSKVFVSYSRQNSEFVLNLIKQLKQNHVNVWLDQYDIEPGKRWDIAIEEALEAATHILFVASEQSVKSETVRDELDYALEKSKPIIPVVIDDTMMPLRVRRFQYVDFRNDYDRAFIQLMSIFPPDAVQRDVDVRSEKSIPSEHDPITTLPGKAEEPDFDQPLPEIKGFTVENLISNTGISAIYVAHDEQGKKHILKRRVKDPIPAIDFSRLNIKHKGLVIPTRAFEDDIFIYELSEYIEGWSLSEVIMMNVGKIRGTLLELWTHELLTIVNVLHSHQPPIIHRDIKPDNILVTPKTHNLVLLDLSSAVFYEPDKTYDSLGTIGYMPPEQLQGKPTPASDLYAIAATMHRMNTGEQPPNVLERILGREHFTLHGAIGRVERAFTMMATLEVKNRAESAADVLPLFSSASKTDPITNKSSENEIIKRILKGEEIRLDQADVIFPDGSIIPTELIQGPNVVTRV